MRILVLGSRGFIGSALTHYFYQLGNAVTGCDRATSGDAAFAYVSADVGIENIFRDNRFDFCINASGSGNVSLSVSDPVADFESNSFETIRILDSIRKSNQFCKYLHISSAAVYGNPSSLPVPETAATSPLSPYGWHKLISEMICKEYQLLYGLPIIIIRPFSIYGPGLRKQLFWDLYQKLIAPGNDVLLHGTGNESRDFIYIDDVVRCIGLLVRKAPFEADIYNVGSGDEHFIKDVVFALTEKLPINKHIKFNQHVRMGDPLNWRADISKLNSMGFEPMVSFPEGLDKVAAWFIQESHDKKY